MRPLPYSAYKSSGIESLRQLPAHWEVRRLKSLCSHSALYGANVSADSYEASGVRFIRTTDITDDGQLHEQGVFLPERIVEDYVLSDGDLLVSRSGTVGRSFVYYKEHHGTCAYAGYLVRFVPKASVSSKYLYLFTKTPNFTDFLKSVAILSTIENVNGEKYANCPFPFPPLNEQISIARFLDHATDQIERYICAQEKLIALLEEQKQVMIHDAITGRIDVRTGKPYPTYKPSGVEWLGDVPNHWKVSRAKRVFWPRTEYARPDDIQLSATQAYGVIAQQKYEERIGRKVTKVLRHLDKRRHVEVDDFVISMRSFQGGLERAWESGCIRSSYIVLRPVTKLSVDYYSHLFKSIGYIAALQLTANFIRDGQDLNFSNFCQVDLPFPPRSEQKEISDALNDAIANIVSSINRANREIELLREYRTRLIADVVTGKLDVREAAANLPELKIIADGGGEKTPAEPDSQQSNTTLHNEAPPATPGASS